MSNLLAGNKEKTSAIKACLAGRFDEQNVFIVTSSPRSGSTLLGQVLISIPDSCLLFEPLHLQKVPEAKAAHFSWRTYVEPGNRWDEGETFLRRVFEGRVINEWTSREMSLTEACRATKMIVKFVRANRLLPWICQTFEVPSPILLLRHPCAVVASQLRAGWMNTQRPSAPSYLGKFPLFQFALSRTEGEEENLAALWALDQLTPLLQDPPHPWIIITYEELILRLEPTLAKIFQRWNLNGDVNDAKLRLNRPSSVVTKSGISGLNGWKSELTDRQITRILSTVNAFGLTFYTLCDEADYSVLNGEYLTELIRRAGTG